MSDDTTDPDRLATDEDLFVALSQDGSVARTTREPIEVHPPTDVINNSRLFLDAVFGSAPTDADTWLLRRYHDSLYRWKDTYWKYLPYAELEAYVRSIFNNAWYAMIDRDGEPEQRNFDCNMSKKREIVDAIRDEVFVHDAVNIPSWVSGRHEIPGPSPANLIPCQNGLLYTPTRTLREHDPRFFCTYSLGFDYVRDAPPPERWLQFLEETHPGDQQSIDTLQEIFGYLLTPDNSQQKFFILVGEKRSGKGTTVRVLEKIIGETNSGAASLSSLSNDFGLEALTNKTLVILGDETGVSKSKGGDAVRNLLNITGNDVMSINPKGRAMYSARLPCRFVMLANTMPQLPDPAQALQSRMIVIPYNESFYKKEDRQLDEKLESELPGILNWALDGLDRLRRRGYFKQPDSGKEDIEQLNRIVNPVSAFLEECCEIGPEYREPYKDVFEAYQKWCEHQNLIPVAKTVFGMQVRALHRKVHSGKTLTPDGGSRVNGLIGLRLSEETRAEAAASGWAHDL